MLLLVKQQFINMVPRTAALLSAHTISFYNNQCVIVMFNRHIDALVRVQCSLHYPSRPIHNYIILMLIFGVNQLVNQYNS